MEKRKEQDNTNYNELNKVLCERIQAGDVKAEEELLDLNKKLIFSIANQTCKVKGFEQMRAFGYEKEDFHQVGRVAMLKAARIYDAKINDSFGGFAKTVISNAMWDLKRNGETSYEWKSVGVEQRLFFDDIPFDENGWLANSVVDIILAVSERDPCGNYAIKELELEKLRNRFENLLSEREKVYLTFRFGIVDEIERNLTETARYFHIRSSKARKIEMAALKKLREGMLDSLII